MLAASASWRCCAPLIERSSAIWVVSNSTGGRISWREEGGGPSLDLTRLHPWCALPLSAPVERTFRVLTGLPGDRAPPQFGSPPWCRDPKGGQTPLKRRAG